MSQINSQRLIEGAVFNDDSYSIEGVHVLNITSEFNTITDSDGNFKIYASLNDEIIFSAIQFKRKKIIINDDILNSISVKIFLEEFVNELDEVIVNSSRLSGNLSTDLINSGVIEQINFDDVGIPGFKGIRMESIPTNTQLVSELLLAPLSGGLNIERMYKWFSGYYKNLKKVREYSNDYDLIDQIIKFYGQSFFIQEFNLKIDNIHNFVSSTYLNYPVEKNFKMGNYSVIIEYFKKNFESFNN
ncbi:MAG: carboxypeptidase-like regulatory domain-containing protein [Bacteroidetes bacterium]|nr:carboxypeptidase-like regulatory domain-containing protein [Bacteroidota bacterium]MDA0884996.1 carboxypeptidase-like regulatory domain-containing protein [Bacteroidota bacterium]